MNDIIGPLPQEHMAIEDIASGHGDVTEALRTRLEVQKIKWLVACDFRPHPLIIHFVSLPPL